MITIDDAGVVKIIQSSAKQRQDSIEQFQKGGREDLVANEQAELNFLKSFLPEQMGEAEIRSLVEAAVAQSGATSAKEMGAVMKILMPQVQGKADGKVVTALLNSKKG